MPDSPARHLVSTSSPDFAGALTPRQRLFCSRIVGGATGAEAARQAGYSAQTAAQQASRLLTQAKVRNELARLHADAAAAQQAALDRMLSKVEQVYGHAIRQRQCAAALRAIEPEGALRQHGARSLPAGVSPADISSADISPADISPSDLEPDSDRPLNQPA